MEVQQMNETNVNGNGHAGNGNGHAHVPGDYATTLANKAIENQYDNAGRVCRNERERIEAANRPAIVAAKAELETVERELRQVTAEVAKLPPEGELRSRRRRALGEFAIALLFFIGGLASALVALDPFALGSKKYFLAVALAIAVPYAVDMVLERWARYERFMKALSAFTAAIAIIAMMTLAILRGEVVGQQQQQANAVVAIDGDAVSPTAPPNTFYQRTERLLQIFMVLAAFAMELIAGYAFHAARRLWAEMPANAAELREKARALENRRVELVQLIETLEREPDEFVSKFWRDYHVAQMQGCTGNRVTKMFVAAFCCLLFSAGMSRAYAAEPLNLVVALDLTASVAGARGLDQKTELQHDVSAVGKLLATIPADSRVTVIGITDRSFARPYVLLSAHVDGNEGYFKERIASAHRQLLATWQKRSQGLLENFQQTDLLGALVMSAQVFEPKAGHRNVLVIFSDMRHETRSLNFSRLAVVPVGSTLGKVECGGLIADLNGIDVYVLGVDAAGKSVAYWNSLRNFWLAYFGKAGANVRLYSMLRDLPQF
jgi:hypothetical protein